jgi:hypothetical protein
MDEAVPTSDDELRRPHYHPSDAAGVEFDSDPVAADAAADLASDFGVEFLEAATRGQDLSDVILERDDMEATEELLVLEDDLDHAENPGSGDSWEGSGAASKSVKLEVPCRTRIREHASKSRSSARSRSRTR